MADPRSSQQIKNDFVDAKNKIVHKVEELKAVRIIEYHNKNWLSGDNKTRCEEQIRLMDSIINDIEELRR